MGETRPDDAARVAVRRRVLLSVGLIVVLASGACGGTQGDATDAAKGSETTRDVLPLDLSRPDLPRLVDVPREPDSATDAPAETSPLPDAIVVDVPGPPVDAPAGKDLSGPDAVCGAGGVGCPCAAPTDCLAVDDGDRCNGVLLCVSGACAIDPTSVVVCPAGDGVCGTFRCNPATGGCDAVPLGADGTACDDGEPCTGGDRCGGGSCLAGPDELCEPAACVPSGDAPCGAVLNVSTALPGATNAIAAYACASGAFAGPERAYRFVAAQEKLLELQMQGGGVFELLLLRGGGSCAASACVASTSGTLLRHVTAGEAYYLVVDGPYAGTSVLRVVCHDRGPEACANFRDDDWDGSTDCADDDCGADPACIPRVCSDGICHPTREDCESCPEDCGPCSVCPDGTCTTDYEDCVSCAADCGPCAVCPDGTCSAAYEDCASCAADCGACPECGDGTCNGSETCATCEADCGACTLECTDEELACGQRLELASLGGDTNDLSSYGSSCANGAGNKQEHAYRFVSATARRVSLTLRIEETFGECDDYDLYVTDGACEGSACVAHAAGTSCTETLTFDAVARHAYAIAVEVYGGGSAGYALEVRCD